MWKDSVTTRNVPLSLSSAGKCGRTAQLSEREGRGFDHHRDETNLELPMILVYLGPHQSAVDVTVMQQKAPRSSTPNTIATPSEAGFWRHIGFNLYTRRYTVLYTPLQSQRICHGPECALGLFALARVLAVSRHSDRVSQPKVP